MRHVQGQVADGYEPIRLSFEQLFRDGLELGAGLAVTHRGRVVVDLWGGTADARSGAPWQADTRAVVFSVTKGLTAMALAMLHERGQLDWESPVAAVWPEFAQADKGAITLRTLFNHRAGLPVLEQAFTLAEVVVGGPRLRDALAAQRPVWSPGADQGYHATTFGLYAAEVFQRLAGESVGTFLARELFGPLNADVSLGTPPEVDARVAALVAPTMGQRVVAMLANAAGGNLNEARVLVAALGQDALPRRAFTNPHIDSPVEYGVPAVWRAELPWASATATARGIARAYVPFACGGEADGRRYVKEDTLHAVYERQSWSDRDRVMQKPLGWSQGFLKDDVHVFSPVRESFGHAGLGGALGWADPVNQLTIGYVPNKLAPQVRSPRVLSLCHALYRCEAVRG